MFICGFCGGQSASGQAERLIVTSWRAKTYESKKMDPLPGTSNARWTKAGVGYEAAEVKKACPLCDVKNAPLPARDNVNTVMQEISAVMMKTAASMGV